MRYNDSTYTELIGLRTGRFGINTNGSTRSLGDGGGYLKSTDDGGGMIDCNRGPNLVNDTNN